MNSFLKSENVDFGSQSDPFNTFWPLEEFSLIN